MKKYIVAIGTLFVFAIGAFILTNPRLIKEDLDQYSSYYKIKELGYENPQKRAEQEYRMLVDPRTGKIPDNILTNELFM